LKPVVKRGDPVVRVDPRYFRPAEVDALQGDAAKARRKLGWKPRTTFAALVQEMMQSDLREARRELAVRDAGFKSSRRHE
ncbi:MAG: GDP-mannose 4,6-dehydratase, partial [Gammaproteobacteria bacterium]